MGVKKLLSILRRSHEPDTEALSAYADGRLNPEESRALDEHMAACLACAAHLEALRRVAR
jgi:anti-sigma factor RsiW